jgi:hypothetical protein
MDNMVKLLYEKETIFQTEVDMLFEGKPPEEIIKISNDKALEKMKQAEEERAKKALEEAESKKKAEEELQRKLAEAQAEIKAALEKQAAKHHADKPVEKSDDNSSDK